MYKSITVIIISLFILFSLDSFAQSNDEDSIKTGKKRVLGSSIQSISASYILGGQVYNNDFVYNPGFSIEFSQSFMLGDKVSVGVGAGYMGLENEKFIPLFAEITGYQKKNSQFAKFRGGYSHAWSEQTNDIEGYDLNGGLFVDFGIGREWKVNKKLSLVLQASYRHQFATMTYQMFGNREFRDAINYDMLILTVGILNR